jgi:hypothetical protein
MPARTPSTFRLIGAGVTSMGALAAIFGSGNAQTLANLESDRGAYLAAHCDHIKDHAKAAGCYAEKSIEYSRAHAELMRKEAAEHREAITGIQKERAELQKATAELQKAGEASRTRAQCLSDLSSALTANPPRITVAEARAAKTTPTPSDDPCVWRERLAPRLGALTKQ